MSFISKALAHCLLSFQTMSASSLNREERVDLEVLGKVSSLATAQDESSGDVEADALFADVISLLSSRRSGGGPLWVFAYASLIWRPDLDHAEACVAALGGFWRRLWQACPVHRGTAQSMGRVATLVPAAIGLRWSAVALPHGAHDEPAVVALGARAMELWLRGDGGGGGGSGGGCGGGAAATVEAAAEASSDASSASECEFEGGSSSASSSALSSSPEWPVVHGMAYRLIEESQTAMLRRLCQRERAGYRPRLVRVALSDFTSVVALTFCGESGSTLWTRESNTQVARVVARAVGASGPNVEYLALLLAAMRARGVFDRHLEQVCEALDATTKRLAVTIVERELIKIAAQH